MPQLIIWYYKKKKSGYYLLHISCVQSAATWRLCSESIPSAIISEHPGHVRRCAGQTRLGRGDQLTSLDAHFQGGREIYTITSDKCGREKHYNKNKTSWQVRVWAVWDKNRARSHYKWANTLCISLTGFPHPLNRTPPQKGFIRSRGNEVHPP